MLSLLPIVEAAYCKPGTRDCDHLSGAGCIFHLIPLIRLHLTTHGPQQYPLLRALRDAASSFPITPW